VIHNVFPVDQLRALHAEIHAWGLATPVTPPQTYIDETFHAIEAGISPRQGTSHNYHAYNFNKIEQLPEALSQKLLGIFNPLLAFQNALTSQTATLEKDEQGRYARPQVLQYPRGGGHLARHTHPLEPQRVGLILGLSERGKDFQHGSTHFDVHGEDLGTDEIHNIGDMILFRFDIPHWITPIDEDRQMDYKDGGGRWTAVLPFR
jgi:hypothetical protein